MTPLITQPLYLYTPSVDEPDVLDSSLIGTKEDVSYAARLASVGKLPGDHLMAADDEIFGIYQDWVNQNNGTHLYVSIEGDSKCKKYSEKSDFYAHPKLWRTVWMDRESVF